MDWLCSLMEGDGGREREDDQGSCNVETVKYSKGHHQKVEIFLMKIFNKLQKKINKTIQ